MFPRYPQLYTLVKRYNSSSAPKVKYLSKQELERLFLYIKDSRDKALFGLVYLYGLRVSELVLLKLEDVDFEKGRILIRRTKGGIGGERPLFKTAEKFLKRYLKKRHNTDDGLFTTRQGNISKQRIQQLFYTYAKKAGLDPRYSVHCLRHSIATHLLEAGEGIEFVRDHLGHRNIQNTMIYAQITDSRRDESFKRVEESSKIARI
ncbi:phage integrase family protein [Candidatus Poribacteria bacterium]|nr:phage integrase family protein [Candidatus Poribacteria bacterium]